MRIVTFKAGELKKLLKQRKIMTMPEMKASLGTSVEMTVWRKLKQLTYHSSYSHQGKYYVLDETVRFDHQGLWSLNSVRFSHQGTLIATVRCFINQSDAGYAANELEGILKLPVREALLGLFKKKQIYREKWTGVYVYFSVTPSIRKRQLLWRRECERGPERAIDDFVGEELLVHEMKAAIILFYSLLNEKQRRLYAGLESLKLGHGGARKVAAFLCIDAHTVARGRQELLGRDVEVEGIRKKGGGRLSVKKKRRKS